MDTIQEYVTFLNENLLKSHYQFDQRFYVGIKEEKDETIRFELRDNKDGKRNQIVELHRENVYNLTDLLYTFIVTSDFWSKDRETDNIGF